ncbi:MAG: hypothetical protein R2863_04990 [Candidatus Kapaibacterium sp.]|nr:hypothetical protein [Ignavibacteriota bacterium]
MIDEQARFMSDKYSTVKSGENVLHLDYYEGLLNKEDIENIQTILSSEGFELSSFDKTGIPYANLEDFTLTVALFINENITQTLISGLVVNAIWDVIKSTTILIWKKTKSKKLNKTTLNSTITTPINMGLKVSIDENTNLDLMLNGDIDKKVIGKTLDDAFELIKKTKKNPTPQSAKFYKANSNGEWIEIDIQREILKKIKKKEE